MALKRQRLGGFWKPSSGGSRFKGSRGNAGPEEGMLWDLALGARDREPPGGLLQPGEVDGTGL